MTLGFGAIGFLDDYNKVRKASTAGVSGRVRLLAEFAIAGLAAFIITRLNGTQLYVPFFSSIAIDLGYFYIVFAAFTIVAFGNAVNLTDGLDGLATMPVIIACVAFMIIAYLAGNARFAEYLGIPYVAGAGDLAIFCGAIVGAGLAFLWFNAPPAAVFMGDTGSLALGGAIGTRQGGTDPSFFYCDNLILISKMQTKLEQMNYEYHFFICIDQDSPPTIDKQPSVVGVHKRVVFPEHDNVIDLPGSAHALPPRRRMFTTAPRTLAAPGA